MNEEEPDSPPIEESAMEETLAASASTDPEAVPEETPPAEAAPLVEDGSYVIVAKNLVIRWLLRFFWVPIAGTVMLYLVNDITSVSKTTLFQWTFSPAHLLGFWIASRVLRIQTPRLFERLVENDSLSEEGARAFGERLTKQMNGRGCEIFSIFFASLFLLFYLVQDWSFAPVSLGFHTLFDVSLSYLLGQILWKGSVIGIGIHQLGRSGQLRIHSFHRDRCGGLSSLGELCLNGSLVLLVAGAFLGFWLTYSAFIYPDVNENPYLSGDLVFLFSLGLLFVTILTVTFLVLPLRSIHLAMSRRARELESRYTAIANELANKEEHLLTVGPEMSHADFALECERIRSLRTILDRKKKLPRWPIPVNAQVRFATAQVPVALGLAASVQQLSSFAFESLFR